MILSGTPPSVLPRAVGLNTHTSARPIPSVVRPGSPAPGTLLSDGSVRCWPRWAVVTKARAGEPAKTMSRGSSPTSRVRTTRGAPSRLTTLTLSDRWLTTQISLSVRAATATGSRPTGTRAKSCRPVGVMLKMSSVLFGVLTANRRVPSGDCAIGRTWPLSKAMKPGAAAWAVPGAVPPIASRAAMAVPENRRSAADQPPARWGTWEVMAGLLGPCFGQRFQ